MVEVGVSILGVHATWAKVESRERHIALWTFCWGVQCVVEGFYFMLVMVAYLGNGADFLTNLLSSATFEKLSSPLHRLFVVLEESVTGFVLFSGFTMVVFAGLSFRCGFALWRELIKERSDESVPLLIQPPRASRERFGCIRTLDSISEVARDAKPAMKPFKGKGNRLGT